MMSHQARVEELEDSDPDEVDISSIVNQSGSQDSAMSMMNPTDIPVQAERPHKPDVERIKKWQCIYPVYFDATRTREEGRRVSKSLAVENPLAREICDAVYSLGFRLEYEVEKTHPKDWANPGRVKVLLKEGGNPTHKTIQNKQHLLNKVAEFLKSNPPDQYSPLRVRIHGMPPMKEPPPPPAVPKGWKMGTILPILSPAISGGGVSENLFKDMMAEMSGGTPGEITSGSASSTGKTKKDKKNKKG